MDFNKPIEQYLFCNLLTKIHVFMYLKDIIRGGLQMKEVLVSFPLTGRKGKDVKKKGESNLLDICSMIALPSDNGRYDYLKSIRCQLYPGDNPVALIVRGTAAQLSS